MAAQGVQGSSAGQPTQVMVTCRGVGGQTEASINQILALAFNPNGASGLVLGSTAAGWNGLVATGPYEITFTVAGGVTVATDVSPWKIIPSAFVLTGALMAAKTAPTTSPLTVDLLYSTDSGTTFTSTTSGNGYPIEPGVRTAGYTSGWAPTSFAKNTIFRMDVLAVGSGTAGSDLTVTLFGDAAQ